MHINTIGKENNKQTPNKSLTARTTHPTTLPKTTKTKKHKLRQKKLKNETITRAKKQEPQTIMHINKSAKKSTKNHQTSC